MDLKKVIGDFPKKRIAIVGDVMLDKYVYGSVDRISPEAPVPVVKVEKEVYELGGAANVAANIVSLGGQAFLFGYVGNDSAGEKLFEKLRERNINHDLNRILDHTIQKERIIGNDHPIARIDKESTLKLTDYDKITLGPRILKENPDIIIVSDYAKGVITNLLISEFKGNEIKVIVDPKPKNNVDYFGAYLITPNFKEAMEMTGLKQIEDIGEKLREKYCCNILITKGKDGMTLFDEENGMINFPTQAREVYDVTGAGDSVVATLGLGLASGLNLKDSIFLANNAAGIAISKAGTAAVLKSELEQIIEKETSKVKTLDELKFIRDDLYRKNKKIVWTNGCFDILHIGHLDYLEKAKKLGDYLIVGLNSDKSVKKLKGEDRPVYPEQHRVRMLSALSCVDYVTIFNELTTENCLRELKPDVFVKGGDYDLEKMNQDERHIIENYRGNFYFIPKTNNISTTEIIKKINNR